MYIMNNTKTLYVSDMDGTLLNSQSVLSNTTKEKLNNLIRNGAMFTVATARTPATVVSLMKDVEANLPFIVMAGCALWDNKSKAYESVRLIAEESVSKIISLFDSYGVSPFVYHQDGNSIKVSHIQEMTEDEKAFIKPRIKTPLKHLETCRTLKDVFTDDVMLIFCMGEFKRLRDIADKIDALGIECTCNCYHDILIEGGGVLDIYLKGTTKAAAILALARKIGSNRIVVFGDNLNDIPMMKIADRSIAVSNAFDEVKDIADEIIGSNDNDAVVKWIEDDFKKIHSSLQ